MKTLKKAMDVYQNSPEEAINMVAGWLEQAEMALDNTPKVVKCIYNSGHGDSVIRYGEVRQDIYGARQREFERIKWIYEIVSEMD